MPILGYSVGTITEFSGGFEASGVSSGEGWGLVDSSGWAVWESDSEVVSDGDYCPEFVGSRSEVG